MKLTCALENMRQQVTTPEAMVKLQQGLRGIEKKSLPHSLAVTNLILHDIEVPDIYHGNGLTRKPQLYRAGSGGGDFDQPALWRRGGAGRGDELSLKVPHQRNGRSVSGADYAPAERRRAGGPSAARWLEGVKTRIKEELLAKCNLHTIVRLPNGVFNPYTGINTNLLFFEKG